MKIIDHKDAINRRLYNNKPFVETAIYRVSCPNRTKKKAKKSFPGQMRLPWDEWEATNEEIENVACKFIFANCYNPDILHHSQQPPQNEF